MKKEQLLLVVAIVLAALVVWGSTGLYASVGDVSDTGKSRTANSAFSYDPAAELSPAATDVRPFNLQFRTEERPPLPDLDPPPPMALEWVAPVPTPGPGAAHWSTLRGEITTVEPPAEEEADDPGGDDPDEDGDDDDNPLDDEDDDWDPDKEARIVFTDGNEWVCLLEPLGPDKGKDTWEILANWGKVTFKAHHYNERSKKKSRMGSMTISPDGSFAGSVPYDTVQTVHLAKTLEKQFHERRIRTRTRDDNRETLVELARWTVENLAEQPPEGYGLDAMDLALQTMEKARAISEDLETVKELGGMYRAAFELDKELALYQDYLSRKAGDVAALYLVGECLLRNGALGPAADTLGEGGKSGDAATLLALAEVREKMGDTAAAFSAYERAQSSPNGEHRARSLVGMARIRLAAGELEEARRLATSAKSTGVAIPEVFNTLGSIEYCLGKYADAESNFGQADGLWGDVDTTARSNRGFALLMLGRLEEAKVLFDSCLDVDPLNYFAPLVGLGDLHQRWGDVATSNDYFDTALQRKPNDPWILVRRGTTRLRDNLPARALEVGRRALASAPSSVDTLRLVGLTSGALAEPDHETAVSHLARASEKEPKNERLLSEWASALLEAGKIREASTNLDEVTDVNKGFGRNNPRLLSLAAYAMFLGKEDIEKVTDKLASVDRKRPSPAIKEWAKEARAKIVAWSITRIWVDLFERQSSATVGNGWKEFEAPGANFSLADGRVVVKGDVVKDGLDERKSSYLRREEQTKGFVSLEVSFKARPGIDMLVHVFKTGLPVRGGKGRAKGYEVGFGVDRTGNLRTYVSHAEKRIPWQEPVLTDADGNPRKWPADDAFHTVKIERFDHKLGKFHIYFDGERVSPEGGWEVPQIGLQTQGGFIGFLVDGEVGALIDAEIEEVRVTRMLR